MLNPVAVLGHGPVADATAAALCAAGWPVTHVCPEPAPLPFALPIHCPIPELSKLNAAQPAMSQPMSISAMPQAIAHDPGGAQPWLVQLSNGARLEVANIIVASSRLAVTLLKPLGIDLPLRPARAHQLRFPGITAEKMEGNLAAHLGFGTIAAFPYVEDAQHPAMDVVYDGLADPTQATFQNQPDERVVRAISSWLAKYKPQLIPLPDAVVTPWLLATTPDYMPLLGPWLGTQVPKGLYVAAGYGAWGPVLAAGVAQTFVNALNAQQWPAELAFADVNRFAEGRANPVTKPIWLIERDNPLYSPNFAGQVRLVGGKAMSFMNNVQLVGSGPPEYASNVQLTEKVIQHAGSTKVREVGRKKLQMSGMRK